MTNVPTPKSRRWQNYIKRAKIRWVFAGTFRRWKQAQQGPVSIYWVPLCQEE